MAAKDRILDAIQARLGGVTEPFVATELASACEEFFERSGAWVHTMRVVLKAGKRDHVLVMPTAGARIVRLEYAGRGSSTLRPVPAFVEGVESADLMQLVEPSLLRLRTERTEDMSISVVATLAPTEIDAIPEHLMARHREALADGGLSRLFAIAQRPWTSTALAVYHGRRFTRSIAEARVAVQRGYGGPLWSYPPFA